jgi:hypothetical protein
MGVKLDSMCFSFGFTSCELTKFVPDCSYGGEGYQIVTIALMFLFPDQSFDLKPFHPLSWKAIIHDVLLPETVVYLIQDDLQLSRAEALKTLRTSAQYGSLQFPGDDSEHVAKAHADVRRIMDREKVRYRLWVDSRSLLGFNDWVHEQTQLADEFQMKKERMDIELGITGASTMDATFTVTDIDGHEVYELLDD